MDSSVDLRQRDMYELAVRIGSSWVQIRRGAGGSIRDYLLGAGDDALEQGQMDSLDLLARHPSWRMSDLAEALRIDPSTATPCRATTGRHRASPSDARMTTTAGW